MQPYLGRVFADFPESRAEIARAMEQAYRDNGEEGLLASAHATMFAVGEAVTPYYLLRAEGRDLIAFYRMTLSMANALNQNDPIRCANFYLGQPMADGSPAVDTTDETVASFSMQMQVVTGNLYLNAADQTIVADTALANQTLTNVWGTLATQMSQQTIELVAQQRPPTTGDDYVQYCTGVSMFFGEVLRQPREETINVFRFFQGLAS